MRVGVRIAGRRSGIGIASVNGSGGLDGIDDLLVACAATQVTLNGLCDFITGGSVVFVEQRLRELRTVDEISQLITTKLDQKQLFQLIGESMRKIFNAQIAQRSNRLPPVDQSLEQR